MHCPYCGGLNRDGVSFCSFCGRDLVPPAQIQQTRQPNQQSARPPTTSPFPYPPPPQQPVQRHAKSLPNPSHPPTPSQSQHVQPARPTTTSIAPLTSPIMNAPEPPAPFPPHTMEQLHALVSGALAYTVVDETIANGRKKTVRITYARAIAWQQVATLLKAYQEQEQQFDTFETLIIQGVQAGETNPYRFTNGQLCFDRHVRLGDRLLNRFQIETGSGFESDAIRIVLSEETVGA